MSRLLREQGIPCTWNFFLNFRDAIRVRFVHIQLEFWIEQNWALGMSWSGMLWIPCQSWSQKTQTIMFDSFHSTYNTHLKRILGLRLRKSSYYSLCLYKAFSFTGSFSALLFISIHPLTILLLHLSFVFFSFFYVELFISVHK